MPICYRQNTELENKAVFLFCMKKNCLNFVYTICVFLNFTLYFRENIIKG